MRSSSRRTVRAMATASSWVRTVASSLRSPPETNARSPPPRMTSTAASAASASSSAWSSSATVANPMALRTSGRSMVMRASPVSVSRVTLGTVAASITG